MKSRSFYTNEVTKELMQVCEKEVDRVRGIISSKVDNKELTFGQIEALNDELVALVDLMSYIDSRHKDYLIETLVDRKKAALKTMWQAFKLQVKGAL